jgi:hypothetical protein
MRFRYWILGAAAVWGAAAIAGLGRAAESERCKLELVRLEPVSARAHSPKDYLYRNVYSQGFYMQISEQRTYRNNENAFREAVKKEPEKYLAKNPFRNAARLGSKWYGFVLDQKEEASKGYDRLYFDLNGNGDLTDDQPIDALPRPESRELSDSYVENQFPRVDLPIDVEGKKLDYSFFLEADRYGTGPQIYVSVSLRSAVYCRGEIALDGKTIPIAVLDHNSNGRFDDVISLEHVSHGANGELYPDYGDMLLIDPENLSPRELQDLSLRGGHFQYLSKLNALKGIFYEMQVSPVGDELTYKPSTTPRGKVTSPHAPCAVELISEQGYLSLALEKSQPAEVPAGDWRLLSYTLKVENWKEPEKKLEVENTEVPEKQAGAKPSLFEVLKKAIQSVTPEVRAEEPLYGPPNQSLLSARGTNQSEPLRVEADQTAALKFGPPYKPLVKMRYFTPGTANLYLAITGADGEVISNLYINGRRPPKPKLTITDPQGEVVQKGNFEYG